MRVCVRYLAVLVAVVAWGGTSLADDSGGQLEVLPGTEKLEWTDDIASRLVEGVDRFLLREIDLSVERRAEFWHRDQSSVAAYNTSIEPNRQRLAHILGVRDARVAFDGLTLVGTTSRGPLVAQTDRYKVFAVSWPVVGPIRGEGLLLVPHGAKSAVDVIAVPDADQTPEMICGLEEGVPEASQFARHPGRGWLPRAGACTY